LSHARHRLGPNLSPHPHLKPNPNLSLSRRINHYGIRYGHAPMFHTRLSSVTVYRQDTGVTTQGGFVAFARCRPYFGENPESLKVIQAIADWSKGRAIGVIR